MEGLLCERVGDKKFGMSFETQENQTLGRDIPEILPGYPGGACLKSLRKRVVFDFWPLHLYRPGFYTELQTKPPQIFEKLSGFLLEHFVSGVKKTPPFRFPLLKIVVLDWFMVISSLFLWSI